MDKNTMMQELARELNKKDSFNGAWLYAEKGGIVSCAAGSVCSAVFRTTQPASCTTASRHSSTQSIFFIARKPPV